MCLFDCHSHINNYLITNSSDEISFNLVMHYLQKDRFLFLVGIIISSILYYSSQAQLTKFFFTFRVQSNRIALFIIMGVSHLFNNSFLKLLIEMTKPNQSKYKYIQQYDCKHHNSCNQLILPSELRMKNSQCFLQMVFQTVVVLTLQKQSSTASCYEI